MALSRPAIAMGTDGTCRLVQPPAPGASAEVAISAAVGEKAANRFEDVRTVQDALNQVPTSEGGPDPALKVDGLCWSKTTAAIRKFQKQACGFKWPDGVIAPGKRTHQRLAEFFVPANPYALPMLYTQVGNAMSWVFAARHAVGEARRHLTQGFAASPRGYLLTDKYFHLGKLPDLPARLAAVDRIDRIFLDMQICIGHGSPLTSPGSGYFQEDPKENRHLAYTYNGGFSRRSQGGGPPLSKPEYTGPVNRQDTILICSRNVGSKSLEVVTYIIVHELAHFVGPDLHDVNRIDDHSYRKLGQVFFEIPPQVALRTADCYAQLAAEARLKREAQPYWL